MERGRDGRPASQPHRGDGPRRRHDRPRHRLRHQLHDARGLPRPPRRFRRSSPPTGRRPASSAPVALDEMAGSSPRCAGAIGALPRHRGDVPRREDPLPAPTCTSGSCARSPRRPASSRSSTGPCRATSLRPLYEMVSAAGGRQRGDDRTRARTTRRCRDRAHRRRRGAATRQPPRGVDVRLLGRPPVRSAVSSASPRRSQRPVRTGGRSFAPAEPVLHVTEWTIPRRADPRSESAGDVGRPRLRGAVRAMEPRERDVRRALDDPDEGLGRAYGTPVPITFDLEWHATAPVRCRSSTGTGSRRDRCRDRADRRGRLDLDGARRTDARLVGDPLPPLIAGDAVDHLGLRAPFRLKRRHVLDQVLGPPPVVGQRSPSCVDGL